MRPLKLLIDACVAGAVALRLRADGHDVALVRELGADPGDGAILSLAASGARILVTIDSASERLYFGMVQRVSACCGCANGERLRRPSAPKPFSPPTARSWWLVLS